MVGAEVNNTDCCTSCKGAGGAVSSNEPVSLVTCFYDVQKLRSSCLPSHPCKGRMLDEEVLDDATFDRIPCVRLLVKMCQSPHKRSLCKVTVTLEESGFTGYTPAVPAVAFNIVL